MYEVLDDTGAQVILGVESGDSIRRLAHHLHTPYETVRLAVNRLKDAGIDEAYVIPQLGEWPFAFTRIDAVYVWTQGSYQVGRSPDDYPLFLAVRDHDVEAWEAFFESFRLPTAVERQPSDAIAGSLQIVFNPQPTLEIEHAEGTRSSPVRRRLHICASIPRRSSLHLRCSIVSASLRPTPRDQIKS